MKLPKMSGPQKKPLEILGRKISVETLLHMLQVPGGCECSVVGASK